MVGARDERVAAMAEQTLAHAWGSDQETTNRLWAALTGTPRAASRFLLAPAPDCPHEPRVRLVTAPPDRGRVLRAALDSPDPEFREAMADVMRATDHPTLIDDFDEALSVRPDLGERLSQRVLDIALENPHLCPPASFGPLRTGRAVVAILNGRIDLLDSCTPRHLTPMMVHLANPAYSSPSISEALRRWLRALGPGPHREELCLLAVHGDAEALAATRESGQEPESPSLLLAFLFATEQWERYDALDPDGTRLNECTRHIADWDGDHLWEVARRNGRTNPELDWFTGGSSGFD